MFRWVASSALLFGILSGGAVQSQASVFSAFKLPEVNGKLANHSSIPNEALSIRVRFFAAHAPDLDHPTQWLGRTVKTLTVRVRPDGSYTLPKVRFWGLGYSQVLSDLAILSGKTALPLVGMRSHPGTGIREMTLSLPLSGTSERIANYVNQFSALQLEDLSAFPEALTFRTPRGLSFADYVEEIRRLYAIPDSSDLTWDLTVNSSFVIHGDDADTVNAAVALPREQGVRKGCPPDNSCIATSENGSNEPELRTRTLQSARGGHVFLVIPGFAPDLPAGFAEHWREGSSRTLRLELNFRRSGVRIQFFDVLFNSEHKIGDLCEVSSPFIGMSCAGPFDQLASGVVFTFLEPTAIGWR